MTEQEFNSLKIGDCIKCLSNEKYIIYATFNKFKEKLYCLKSIKNNCLGMATYPKCWTKTSLTPIEKIKLL